MKKDEITITEHGWADADGLITGFSDSPQYTPFAGSGWLGFLSQYAHGRVYVLAASSGGEVVGWAPVWEIRGRFVGKTAEVPPITPYWGPVIDKGQYGSDKAPAKVNKICSALAAAVAGRYRRARMCLHPTLIDVRPFVWSGWSASPRYTTIINFDDPDAYIRSLSGKVRNKIKQREDVEFVSSDDAGPFVAMYEGTFRRARIKPPITPAGVTALPGVFGRAANFYYIIGFGGKPVAGRFVVRGAGVAYDLLAASAAEGRGPLGAYLVWRELCDLTGAGFKVDMVGVNVPDIARFKESFGGELKQYYVVTWSSSLLVKALASFAGR